MSGVIKLQNEPEMSPRVNEDFRLTAQVPPVSQRPTQQPVKNQSHGLLEYFTLSYLQEYFRINQKDVIERMSLSYNPYRTQFFELTRTNPDLYGPFWILTTLIFLISTAGNLSRFFNNLYVGQFVFKVQLARIAVITVYGFGFGFPILLVLLMRFLSSNLAYIHMICLYGYSLAPFVFILILCTIPSSVFQWILLMYGALNSSAFLVANIHKEIEKTHKIYLIYAIILTSQMSMLIAFKLIFFDIVYFKI